MCLKYFVQHKACEHHEYLGSHHCSLRPCDLDAQHFHNICDNFPIPGSPESVASDSVPDAGASACNICAAKHSNKIDPDEVAVQYYPPTNNYDVEEVRPTGYALPINVVRVQTENVEESDTERDDSYDHDYKSLSDADETEWNETGAQINHIVDTDLHEKALKEQKERIFIQEQMAKQLSNLQDHLAQQRQTLPFAPPGLTPEAYATANYTHHRTPHMPYLASPSTLTMPFWHGTAPSLAHNPPFPHHPHHPYPPPIPLPTPHAPLLPTDPAPIPHRPATPPLTPPMHPVPPRPPPPFIVGSITGAYLRLEAAKRRHMHARARRAGSGLRDALPSRSASLANFVVERRGRRGRRREGGDGEGDGGQDSEGEAWASLPFAGEEEDTEGGEEMEVGERGMGRFSCRLVAV